MRLFLIVLASMLPLAAVTAELHEVRIEKMKFVPEEVHIKAGDRVVWKSYERRGYHSVWFQDEGLAESAPLFPGESWQRDFDMTGLYRYRCGPHPEMRGRVVVEATAKN